jgi:transposase
MNLADSAKIWFVLGTTDMRKSIDGLAVLVGEQLELDVFSGQLFVFCNRVRTIVKILYWDRNGFCLWHKRLERCRFVWPSSVHEVLEMDHRQLRWLLDGLDPIATLGHPHIQYNHIS